MLFPEPRLGQAVSLILTILGILAIVPDFHELIP
jgi:hypothetical protein